MNPLNILRTARSGGLAVALALGLATTASATSEGVVGASGQTNGFYCRNCHSGGTVPTLAFEGPITMNLGATATFRLVVTSRAPAQIGAGLNVAAGGGALGLVPAQGTRLEVNRATGSNEITHSAPRMNDANGQAVFEFTWQAPATAGVYTLFGSATSVNLDSGRGRDAAARTTYEVAVGVMPPTPTPTPPSATPTPTTTGVSACAGDCNSNGAVTFDEVLTGVDMALAVTPLSACALFDANRDDDVTIEENVQAVNGAMACPSN